MAGGKKRKVQSRPNTNSASARGTLNNCRGDSEVTPQRATAVTPASSARGSEQTSRPSSQALGRRSGRRSTRGDQPVSAVKWKVPSIPRESSIWTLRSSTCFTFRLNPNEHEHKRSICEGCQNFFQDKLLTKGYDQHNNLKRTSREQCQRPWDVPDQSIEGKLIRRERIYELCGNIPRTVESIRAELNEKQTKTSQNENHNEKEESTAVSPGDAESPAGQLDPCSLNESFGVKAANKNKSKRGAFKLFDDNNLHLTKEHTDRILANLEGRTSLGLEEKRLLDRLQEIDSSINRASVLNHNNELREEATMLIMRAVADRTSILPHEDKLLQSLTKLKPQTDAGDSIVTEDNKLKTTLTDVLASALKGRTSLEANEMRLLGQLAVVAFDKSNDADILSFPNFTKCQQINLARMPRQMKKGDEAHNNALFRARIKTGRKWLAHLPGSFHDELIATLFFEIDPARAATALKKYHNKHLRMNAEHSSTLKSFVGLNDKQYIRLMRALYYFSGMRMFCLAMQDKLQDVFIAGGTPAERFEKRTLEKMYELYKKYHDEYESLPLGERTKTKREDVTQNMTYSITAKALMDIPLDVISPSSMHVILGWTKKLVEWMMTLFSKIESLEEEKTKGKTTYQFRQAVEEALANAVEYEEFLIREFQVIIQTVEGKKKDINKLMKRVAKAQEKVSTLPPGKQLDSWKAKLEELKIVSEKNQPTKDEIDAGMQFVEQLFLTRQTRIQLEKILEKHQGDSTRALIAAMKNGGVDQKIYHSGSIVGNHCMILAEKGVEILKDMGNRMGKKIKDETNRKYLTDTLVSLKEILGLWYKLMVVMKSKKAQSDGKIQQFKDNTIALNKAVHKLITTPPVPGCELKASKQLKSHLLFDGEILDWLMVWKSLGAFDEQNIEGVHPEFNHLFRRFGNSRGAFQKNKIMREFLFARAPWILEAIEAMLKATARKRKRDDDDAADDADAAGEDGDERDVELDLVEEEDGEEDAPVSAVLTDLETQINSNDALHCKPGLNTHVHACKICGIRLLDFAMKIHCHESHSVIVEDADGADENVALK